MEKLGAELPLPKAVLVISAHRLNKGNFITAVEITQTIHDFGGFPQALFDAQYPAPGDAQLAQSISQLITEPAIGLDQDRGLGTRSRLMDNSETHLTGGRYSGALNNYTMFHNASKLAIPTPNHCHPLIYTLGLQRPTDYVRFFNDRAAPGSLTMTSVLLGTGH